MLLLGHDAALLGLHQVLLGEATGSVLGRAVPDLGLRARGDHLAARLHVLASHVHGVGVRVGVHFYSCRGEINTSGVGSFLSAVFFLGVSWAYPCLLAAVSVLTIHEQRLERASLIHFYSVAR